MILPILTKDFRNPNFKDLKDFLIGILALGLISPLVFIFIIFGINIFSEKDLNLIIRAE